MAAYCFMVVIVVYEYRRKGKHLTPDERIKIERLHRQGLTQTAIAREIGVSQQAISKELKRGQVTQLDYKTWIYYRTYSADVAQRDADYQKTAHGPDLKIGKNRAYLHALENAILAKHSPYAAIKQVAQSGKFEMCISKTTCYRYIKDGLFERLTYEHLPVGHPKKRNGKVVRMRTAHPEHRSIERRDKAIATRQQFGHWEGDSIIGKATGTGESCITMTDRKYRLSIVVKVKEKTAASTVCALQRLRRYFGKHDYNVLFRTLTLDNGSEFADQKGMDKTGVTVFYAHPQSPGERGSNEHGNKMLRRMFPKGQSLKKATQKDARVAQDWLNAYPREMFGGKSAAQMFAQELPDLPLQHPDRVATFFGLSWAQISKKIH